MFQNYLKIALRNIKKQIGYSFINIAGLAIGIACCILIFLFVQDELSYDHHHKKADQIYRATLHGIISTNEINSAVTCAPMAFTFVQDFPEVIQATRLCNFGFPVIRYNDKVFSEEKWFNTDSTVFDVFTIPLIKGDSKTALTKPNTVVISREMEQKYFGDENGLGKTLNSDNRRDYLVTGVMENFPANSHFHADFLASLSTYEQSRSPVWVSNSFYTYFVLQKGFPVKELEAKLPDLVRKYVGPQIQQATGVSYEKMLAGGMVYEYTLQSLTDIHLNSHLENELEPNGNSTYVYLFSVIAIAILLIACINFMNLATARSANRAKEVGIRKTVGSSRNQLIRQFLAETIFMSFISVLFAIIVIELLLPIFNNLTDKNMTLEYFSNIMVIPSLLGIIIFVGILAGIYPAFFLASFKPVNVLKGSSIKRTGKRSSAFRSGLVIFQFTVSIMLIIGTLIVFSQLNYIQNKNLGFNKDQIVVIKKTDDLGNQLNTFKNEILQHPGIVSATNTNTLPGKNFSANAHKPAGTGGEETHVIWDMRSDYDFGKTFEIEMAAGRYLSKNWMTDSSAAVINETAVSVLGYTDPIGKEIIEMGPTAAQSVRYKIVGVMKDFHFQSLHQEIRPMIIKLFPGRRPGAFVSVRLKTTDIQGSLAFLEKKWQMFAANQAFEYVFFDEDFAEAYKSEQQTSKILTIFTALAIIIASLGLFGLASFIAEQRTREIGIRKVLGASFINIIIHLSREFTKWVLIANVIAWPIAYFGMKSWLQNFAYQTEITILTFIMSAILAIVIAVITVSYQSVKAALTNPVDALKYE